MKRKSNKAGLGAPTRVHRSQYASRVADTERLLAHVRTQLKIGDCAAAVEVLVGAAENLGAVAVHADSFKGKSRQLHFTERDDWKRLKDEVTALVGAVDRCFVRKS